jgi:hypothetical protein
MEGVKEIREISDTKVNDTIWEWHLASMDTLWCLYSCEDHPATEFPGTWFRIAMPDYGDDYPDLHAFARRQS